MSRAEFGRRMIIISIRPIGPRGGHPAALQTYRRWNNSCIVSISINLGFWAKGWVSALYCHMMLGRKALYKTTEGLIGAEVAWKNQLW